MPGGIQVRSPDGTIWTIARRWIPRREGIGLEARLLRRGRKRRRDRDGESRWSDWIDVPIDFDLDAIAVVVVVVLAVLAIVFVGWPLVLIGIDLLWLVLVLIVGTIGRLVLRRPWRVEARSEGDRREWFVQGFRQAGQFRDEPANQFRHGAKPSPAPDPLLPN